MNLGENYCFENFQITKDDLLTLIKSCPRLSSLLIPNDLMDALTDSDLMEILELYPHATVNTQTDMITIMRC